MLKTDLNKRDITYLLLQLEEKGLIKPDYSCCDLVNVLNLFILGAKGRLSFIDINMLSEQFNEAISQAFNLDKPYKRIPKSNVIDTGKLKEFSIRNYVNRRRSLEQNSLAVQKQKNKVRQCRIF